LISQKYSEKVGFMALLLLFFSYFFRLISNKFFGSIHFSYKKERLNFDHKGHGGGGKICGAAEK
jgi:hypothetical protein